MTPFHEIIPQLNSNSDEVVNKILISLIVTIFCNSTFGIE